MAVAGEGVHGIASPFVSLRARAAASLALHHRHSAGGKHGVNAALAAYHPQTTWLTCGAV